MSNEARWGVPALVLGAVSISLGTIASKQGLIDGAESGDLLAARFIIAAPLLALTVPFMLRAAPQPAGAKAIAIAVAAGGLFWVAGFGEFEGLDRIPAGMLVLLLATSSLWVALLRWLLQGAVPTSTERLAIGAVIAGVAIMAVPLGAAVDPLGILGGLLSASSFAVFLLVLERNERMPSSAGFAIGMVGGALLLVALDPGSLSDFPGPDLSLSIAVAIGVSSVFWALFVGYGVGATSSLTAAIVVALEPPLVALMALVILGEGLSTRELIGGSIVITAVFATALEAGRQARARGAPA